MSQLLNKLTNLVVSKIIDENLIQTGGEQGSPEVILVDEDNDVTYGPDDYFAVDLKLEQNGIQYLYLYSKNSSIYEEVPALAASQLKQGLYSMIVDSNIIIYDSSFQRTIIKVKSDTLINYTGQDSITIPIKPDVPEEIGR